MAIFSKGYYESILTEDSKKKKIFETVWKSISAINVSAYQRDFSIADSTNNLTDLKNISSRLNSEISICDGFRTSYPKNQDAIQVAIDMKDVLKSLRDNVENSIAFIEGRSIPSKIPVIHKVVDGYKKFKRVLQPADDKLQQFGKGFNKFSKPANDAFNFTDDFANNGIGNMVKGISDGVDNLFGTHRKH